jgi:hypothetical protein
MLGDVQVVVESNALNYQGVAPQLVLLEVTAESETWVPAFLERTSGAPIVLIGPLGGASDRPRQSSPPREVRELSADVSIAEIIRVCAEYLGGKPPEPSRPVRSLPSNPFDFEVVPRDSVAGLPSLQAPLFPISAPPSSHPSKRPSSGAPAGTPAEGDSGAFELDPDLSALLAETEARVASELSPRLTSPPDPNEEVAHSEHFFVSHEVRAALEEPVERYHEKHGQREHSQLSGTPNSHWATRTGIGNTGRRAAPVSSATGDVSQSSPTSAGGTTALPRPKAHEEESAAVPPESDPSAAADAGEGATTRPPPAALSRKALLAPAVPPPPALPRDSWHELEPNTPVESASVSPETDGPPSAPPRAQLVRDLRPTQQPRIRTVPSGASAQHQRPTASALVHDTAQPAAGEHEEEGASEKATEHPPAVVPKRASELPPLGDGDTVGLIARAIRTRYTGTIVIEADGGVRRLVLRDGDFVTAASGLQKESLLAFLINQGILSASVAQRLEHRLPNFGRHAGAALIAAGHLTQEQLWPSLRAHAEFIIGEMLRLKTGVAGLEEQIAERLANEPAVFGGATGAEVFVELVKRVVPPDVAVQRVGGPLARLTEGQAYSLLDECALPREEAEAVAHAVQSGQSAVKDLVGGVRHPVLACTLYALCQLRVLSADASHRRPAESVADDAALDEQAVRELVANRKALVNEGDYFQLLGLSLHATPYDIRRAYVDLKRTFQGVLVTGPGVADLREDVALITAVLDEAYDILHDHTRRERYRRALLSSPE